MFDGKAFGEEMVTIVRGAVDRATAPLIARIEALEKRELVLPEKGDIGPRGEAGEKGEQGIPGRDGRDGAPGRDGEKGADGINGKDGRDGNDGRHGLSAEDVELTVQPDGRTLEFSLKQGDITYAFDVYFPFPMYRGVWQSTETYTKGDMVTWAGSVWHCDVDEAGKPGTDGWTLAVKKGRDGKDAK